VILVKLNLRGAKMNTKEFQKKHPVWHIFYILACIFSLGVVWYINNFIAYAVAKANDKK